MKEEGKNEMDLLLARLARSRGFPGQEQKGNDPVDGHLDVDELNAFAENSLPEAARSFYTEHLAECQRCRKLVTQLTAAAGPSAKGTVPAESRPSFLKRLLSNTSWLKLQYAVPTLAAIAILAFAIVIVRRPSQNAEIAKVYKTSDQTADRPNSALPAPTSADDSRQAPQANVEAHGVKRSQVEANASPAQKDKEEAVANKESTESRNDAIAVQREVQDLKKLEPAKSADQPQRVAAASAPAAPPSTVSTESVTVASPRDVAQAKNEATDRQRDGPIAQRKVQAAEEKKPQPTPADESKGDSAAGGALRPGAFGVAGARKAKPRTSEEETRTVAGRRFRKEHGVWIDTDYDLDMPTVSVVRGSEQYRALVADETGIRTIAEQLSGEVIVVWKGKAYKLH